MRRQKNWFREATQTIPPGECIPKSGEQSNLFNPPTPVVRGHESVEAQPNYTVQFCLFISNEGPVNSIIPGVHEKTPPVNGNETESRPWNLLHGNAVNESCQYVILCVVDLES